MHVRYWGEERTWLGRGPKSESDPLRIFRTTDKIVF